MPREDGVRRARKHDTEEGDRPVEVRHMVVVRRKKKADRKKSGDDSRYCFQRSRSDPAVFFIPHGFPPSDALSAGAGSYVTSFILTQKEERGDLYENVIAITTEIIS